MIELTCPVRDCRQPLARAERQWSCARGHSFDVAKSGYCNLLQPNERRSKAPGDSAEAAKARRRLFDRGVGVRFLDDLASLADELGASAPILDAGCGEGFHLVRLCRERGAAGIGIDISSEAIDLAARRNREQLWAVSNVDRRIPLADASIGTVLSITARINPSEFRRVLRSDGLLFVVVPGPDDLAELRERVLGERTALSRLPDSDSWPEFDLVRQAESRETIEADRETMADLLLSTYRGQRASQIGAFAGLSRLTITQSRSIRAYRPR